VKRSSLTLLILVIMVCICACTTNFSGVRIIQPKIGSSVEDLQPVLQWEQLSQSDSAYDLIIYEGLKVKSSPQRMVGKTVYYRENLQATQHKVEEPLKPSQDYYWSVRVRRGNIVSNWSLYNYFAFYGLGYSSGSNLPFLFRTQEK
jgi:hypothetical protein